MYSSNQVKKLGKRLRNGSRTEEDLTMLASYKASFDTVLFELNSVIFNSLSCNNIPVILSGRSKRIKSLIRKLCRPNNQSMDLSRVDDIVGLRLIVRDIELQNKALEIIKQLDGVKKVTDYREAGRNYRAIHVVITRQDKSIELQIRTCAQHLWAEESESFGEKTKEGNGPNYIEDYLSELSAVCKKVDSGEVANSFKHEFFKTRKPMEVLYPYLVQAYECSSAASFESLSDYSFLVTYDTKTSSLINKDKFWDDERSESLNEYKRICKILDENRYDVLLFNSKLDDALYVTHSRYFPKGIFR